MIDVPSPDSMRSSSLAWAMSRATTRVPENVGINTNKESNKNKRVLRCAFYFGFDTCSSPTTRHLRVLGVKATPEIKIDLCNFEKKKTEHG